MSQDYKKEENWYVKFNLKPLNFYKRIFYGFLWFNNYYPKKQVPYKLKDIERFISNCNVRVNYHYAHKFHATYRPYYDEPLSLKIREWKYEIFLPFPELYQGSTELKQKYYYFTLFHELIHWTGCEFNLNRFSMEKRIKDDAFAHAAEEVIAAMGCLLLMEKFSLDDADVRERIFLYIEGYVSEIINQLANLQFITLEPNWKVDDYIEKNETVKNCIGGLMLKGKDAVDYLVSLQK